MRIGLLSNLKSGRNRSRAQRLLNGLSRFPDVCHVETMAEGAVPEALEELERQDVELLVVNGGDGTLAHVLTAILANGEFGGRVPLIGVLRGGRTNMSALDIGAARDPLRALGRLVEASREGCIHDRIVRRPVMRVAYRGVGGRQVRYGMFFGAGVITKGIEMVHRVFPQGRSQGVFGASMVTGALLARTALHGANEGVLAPQKIAIMADGESVEIGESRLVMATGLTRLFSGLRPFWGEGPGSVRMTAIAGDAWRLGRAVPGILRGRPAGWVDQAAGYVSRNAKNVALRLDAGFTIDGELVEPEEDRVVTVTADERVLFVRA